MADREKVIKALECCIAGDSCISDCPYFREVPMTDGRCITAVQKDALELLKEQKPKIGTWQWKIHGKAGSGGTLGEAICDQCGKSTYATAVKGDLNYCPNCGAKMTEGR